MLRNAKKEKLNFRGRAWALSRRAELARILPAAPVAHVGYDVGCRIIQEFTWQENKIKSYRPDTGRNYF